MDNNKIEVKIDYIAAVKPFNRAFPPDTTLATVKADALLAFGLKEEGGKTFKLFFKKTELSNLTVTLAQISGGKHEITIDLEEFITQG